MECVCGVNAVEITDVLASGGNSNSDTLIIDCRSFLVFNRSHIADSINVHCPPILKRRSGGFIALENIVPCAERRSKLLNGLFPNILLYDESTRELNQTSTDSNLLSVIKSLLKQVTNLTVRFIIGGFEAIQEECPVLCMQTAQFAMFNGDKLSKERKQSPLMTEPAEILAHLYLGDVCHSSQRALLDRLGITALLNVSSSCENHFETDYKYMTIQIGDTMNADLLSWFPKVIDFIDQVAAERGKVLVHCRAGISRSATVCIAYIMQKQGLSLDSAFEFVMLKRPVIDPNLNFIQQLQKFESSLTSQNFLSVSYLSSGSSQLGRVRSAPPITISKPHSVFTFSPGDQSSYEQQMETEQISPPPPTPFFPLTPLGPRSHPPFNFLVPTKLVLSPSSLSQTAASPGPVRTPVRPESLPLFQVSSPRVTQLNNTTDILVGSSILLSPSGAQFSGSPFFNMLQQAGDTIESFTANYGAVPGTPVDRTFTFFGGDLSRQSLSLPLDMASPRQCRPLTPTSSANSGSIFFTSEQTFSTASVPQTPISPHGTPLSPLPSFG